MTDLEESKVDNTNDFDNRLGVSGHITDSEIRPTAPAPISTLGPVVYASIPGFEYAPVGQWKSSLFCCLEQIAPSCLMSFFCVCIMSGQLSEKIGWRRCGWVVSVFIAVIFICIMLYTITSDFFIYIACLWVFVFYLALTLRVRTRILFNIPGEIITDCLAAILCTCCTLAQVILYLVTI